MTHFHVASRRLLSVHVKFASYVVENEYRPRDAVISARGMPTMRTNTQVYLSSAQNGTSTQRRSLIESTSRKMHRLTGSAAIITRAIFDQRARRMEHRYANHCARPSTRSVIGFSTLAFITRVARGIPNGREKCTGPR